MMKNTRPISLWDLNPLDLTYQVNSFTISELQLRVFQIKNREDRLYSIMSFMSSYKHGASLSWIFTIGLTWTTCFQNTQLGNLTSTQYWFTANFRLPPVLPIEVAKGLRSLFVHSLKIHLLTLSSHQRNCLIFAFIRNDPIGHPFFFVFKLFQGIRYTIQPVDRLIQSRRLSDAFRSSSSCYEPSISKSIFNPLSSMITKSKKYPLTWTSRLYFILF